MEKKGKHWSLACFENIYEMKMYFGLVVEFQQTKMTYTLNFILLIGCVSSKYSSEEQSWYLLEFMGAILDLKVKDLQISLFYNNVFPNFIVLVVPKYWQDNKMSMYKIDSSP